MMTTSERIAEQIATMPPALRELLDQLLAAGNKTVDVEVGRGDEAGRVALMLDHPFRFKPRTLPKGVRYRELKRADPMMFEYYLRDQSWSLFTAKFKPVNLKAVRGPTEQKGRKEKQMKDETLPEPQADNELGAAAKRFLASMVMTQDMWRDGTGYDLEALAEIPAAELACVERILIGHRPHDWRDVEALGCIDTPTARAAVEAALKSPDAKVRRQAMELAGDKVDPREREKNLLKALKSDDVFGGLSEAIDEAAEFHPTAVVDALLRGALNRGGPTAVHFAALLFYIQGKAEEPFDWKHRPFFLRFDTADRAERKAVFRELCETIGVDAARYR